MGKVREVSFEEAGQAVHLATIAAGEAPASGAERAAWLGRVGALARDLGALVKEVRLDLMRTVKVIPVEGVLDVPRTQNNPNRVNFTIDTGGRYPDTLWTEFLESPERDRERERLQAMAGKRVRLIKVTEIDFDKDGEIKLDDKGNPEQRSFARGGIIEVVGEPAAIAHTETAPIAQPAEQSELPVGESLSLVRELDAKRELVRACLTVGLPESDAKERAKAVFSRMTVVDGQVTRATLAESIQLARQLERPVA